MGFEPRLDVLPSAQLAFWREGPKISSRFVLYGGTAIALRLGHRSSEDFDFFSSDSFEIGELVNELAFSGDPEVLQSGPNTLTLRVERRGPVKLSFFGGLSFGRIGSPDPVQGQSFTVAALPDLMAVKLKVIWQRAEAKDYHDVAAMIGTGVSLEYGLGCARALYGESFNPAIVLKALTYFEDGDLETLPLEVKECLIRSAKNVIEIPDVKCAARTIGDSPPITSH